MLSWGSETCTTGSASASGTSTRGFSSTKRSGNAIVKAAQCSPKSGTYLTQWGGPGSGNGQFQAPRAAAVDASGNVYVSDSNNNRIQKFGALPTPTKPASWTRLKRLYR